MRRVIPIILLLFFLPAHIFSLLTAAEKRKTLPKGEDTAYVLPSPLLKLTALEFDGLASDFLFLRSLVFYGSTYERKEHPRIKQWELRWMYTMLNASTDLDPYFLDPYYFGEAALTEGNRIKEANLLLEKGTRYRDWDWILPFYLGFNYFYFLHDNEKASERLMTAAKRPGAGSMLATLAARLAYQGKRTENAILFLEEMIKKTKDEIVSKQYKTRLNALKGVLYLERAVAVYKKKFGRTPGTLNELIETGILKKLPQDPYGGIFYLDPKGMVTTTSNFAPVQSLW